MHASEALCHDFIRVLGDAGGLAESSGCCGVLREIIAVMVRQLTRSSVRLGGCKFRYAERGLLT